MELKRRKLILKDEIERVRCIMMGDRHDAAIGKATSGARHWIGARRDGRRGSLRRRSARHRVSNLEPWYAGLAPSNPPNWIFASVWTTLFLLMAFSVWRILRLPRTSARRTALALFFIQLALNAAWSWMFIASDSPLLGIINIVPQWLIIIATIVAFYRLDKIAAWCLFPLAAWVAFAGVLTWRSGG